MEMKWYTIYTKANSEKKVTNILERKKVLNFCPANSMSELLKKDKSNEYFNRYVFVKVFEGQIKQLKQISGVINVLYWRNEPAVINETEIDLVKSFLKRCVNIKFEKRELGFYSMANNVSSSTNENGGKLVDMNNNNKIQVVLPSLGYTMSAELEKSLIRLVSNEITSDHSKLEMYRMAK
ncbi:MAG: transcription termination/antitermination NusG family protein [Ginsengibacter sp.]